MMSSSPLHPAEAAVEQDLHGRVVILDAGHGEGDSPGYAGYVEHVAMLKLAKKIKPLLEARGATVVLTRETDYNTPLHVRGGLINKLALETVKASKQQALLSAATQREADVLQADLLELDRLLAIVQNIIDDPETYAPIYLNAPFDYTYKRKIHPDWQKVFEAEDHPEVQKRFLVISLHSNATAKPINTSLNGADAFYISNSGAKNANYYTSYSNEESSRAFAHLLLDNIDDLGIVKRKVSEQVYMIIREHNVPAVLVENGFHTNAGDRAKLSDDEFLDSLAQVYEASIAEYFNSVIGSLPEKSGVMKTHPVSEWAREGVQTAIERGLVPEELQNNYTDVITRAEFCALAVELIETLTGNPITERKIFDDDRGDVNIRKIGGLGIVAGTGSNNAGGLLFSPGRGIQRQEAAVILARVADFGLYKPLPEGEADFADMRLTYAEQSIRQMRGGGIMSGKPGNLFDPLGSFTREESIITMLKLWDWFVRQ
ncbi:MAG: N-acetylmuramoyl-L-alanine amidase [Oscillospiraceae bacterium]|nr:N-acetylmuramoyl-L-alanine amidase [Oscillospiraceae bacterium]